MASESDQEFLDRVDERLAETMSPPEWADDLKRLALMARQKSGASDNTVLSAALEPFSRISLVRDHDPNGIDAIDAPDFAITPNQVRAARTALNR